MLPYYDLRSGHLAIEMLDERIEGARHVPVTQIPRRDLGPVHLLVVFFSVPDQTCILLCEEEFLVSDPAVPTHIGVGPPSQFDQLGHDLVFARDGAREGELIAVCLPLAPNLIEAGVPFTGSSRLVGIDTVEVVHDGLHRSTEAVEIQPIESGLGRRLPVGIVAGPKPLHESHDVTISPHPRREATKVRQCRGGVLVIRKSHHVAIDSVGIGPIGLDRHGGKAALIDEATSDTGSLPVELVRSVRGLADQNETSVIDKISSAS